MSFYGADVEQLRSLGRDLAREADRIDDIITRLTVQVERTPWRGPDVDRFQSDWRGGLSRGARAAVEGLREASRRSLVNADEQEGASGGSSDPGLLFPPLPIDLLPGDLVPRLPGLPLLPDGPGDFSWPGGWPPEYWDRWHGQIDGWNGAIEATPRFSELFFETSRNVFDTELGESTLTVEEVGTFIPGVSTAIDLVNVADTIHEGNVPVHEAVDYLGGTLREVGFEAKNPAVYLAGAAVGTWNTAIEQFANADFSEQTRLNVVDFITDNPGEAAAAAGEAIVDFLPSLVKNFKFW